MGAHLRHLELGRLPGSVCRAEAEHCGRGVVLGEPLDAATAEGTPDVAGPAAEIDGVDKVVRLVDVVQAVHEAARHLLVQVGVVLVVGRERGTLSVVRLELPVEYPRGEPAVPAADEEPGPWGRAHEWAGDDPHMRARWCLELTWRGA